MTCNDDRKHDYADILDREQRAVPVLPGEVAQRTDCNSSDDHSQHLQVVCTNTRLLTVSCCPP